MARKAANTTATQRAKKAVDDHVETLTIPAETVIAGLKRFGAVCDYVERDMKRGEIAPVHEQDQARFQEDMRLKQQMAGTAAPPAYGAEQKARDTSEASFRLAAMASELRDKVLQGGTPPKNGEGSGQLSPSEGPIKDSLSAIMSNMDRVAQCLDDIGRYIGN